MERIEKSIEVHVPVHTAYNQWTQFEEFPRFMEGIEEVQQTDHRHLHWKASIGGKQKEWDVEINEQEPDRCIAWRSIGGAGNGGRVEFSPISPTDTRVTVKMDYDPEGVVENVGDFLGVTGRRVEGDLERFKSFIETQRRDTGAWRGEIQGGRTERTSGSTGRPTLRVPRRSAAAVGSAGSGNSVGHGRSPGTAGTTGTSGSPTERGKIAASAPQYGPRRSRPKRRTQSGT
jgi:hypothetical protein